MGKELVIKEIFIYPFKGLKGISLQSCVVTELGLANDRIYMIADEQGQLVSQRTHPQLALMQVTRISNSWRINFKQEELIIVDETISNYKMDVDVWGAVFSCKEVSQSASAWFVKQLQIPCKLMVMPSKTSRIKTFNKPPYETYLSFADGYPITTLGTKSMDLLNQKLKNPVKANRFRPNIIIQTNSPHEEDQWEDFRVGDKVKLRNIKPCIRCQVIMIDQELGVMGKEPLATLATYRQYGDGVAFSSNAITINGGEIKIGDKIEMM